MEELRSTEILDKEIQSDARKKAENILKKADKECEDILKSVEIDVERAKQNKTDSYNKKLSVIEKDQNASIPLEKQRIKVSFVQKSIINNINKYFNTLTEEKRIELVLNQFNKDIIADKKLNAYVYGFNEKVAQKAVADKLGSNLLKVEKTEFGRHIFEDDIGLEVKEGIILETESKDFRLRLTLTEIVNRILVNNRAELSEALFGNGGLA